MNRKEQNQILKSLDLASIFEGIHLGLSICDANGRMLYVSSNYEKLLHANAQDVIGRFVSDINDVKPAISETVLLEKKRITAMQENNYGEQLFVTGVPIFDEYNEIKYVVTYNSLEITSLYELENSYKRLQHNNNLLIKEMNSMRNDIEFDFNNIIAESKPVKAKLELLKRLSDSNVPVFIEGEKGNGKTFWAGYLHHISSRADSVWYVWNAGSTNDVSVEDTLFGEDDKPGLLELCDGGSLIIENVELLSFKVQNKLAHIIKSAETDKHENDISVPDVRFIFTSSHSITDLLTDSKISSEFYYSVGLGNISIPPIRQCPEDLSAFIQYYLDCFNEKYSKEISFSPAAKAILMSYEWPGNIKEIEFVIERIVLTNDSQILTSQDLPDSILNYAFDRNDSVLDLKNMMDFYEEQIIRRTYNRCSTSIAVAKELNISQASAYRKLKKYIPGYSGK